MADLNVKYSRAENGLDVAEIDNEAETVQDLRRRNGMSKLEKVLLASTVLLIFVSAVFAALYVSERQQRNLNKGASSSENDGKNCKGADENQDEKRNETTVLKSCDLNPNNANCSNEVTKQAAHGKMFLSQ